MASEALAVLTAYFNPSGVRARRRNYLLFAEHLRVCEGVRLITIECAFGKQPFELPDDDSIVRVRAEYPLWIKENLLNLGLARAEQQYVAWVDGDVIFLDPHWATRAVDALQTYRVIQPWSRVYCLDGDGRVADDGVPAFCRVHHDGYVPGRPSHTGYAWAIRRDVLDAVQGFPEELIVGGADHMMALALFGADKDLWPKGIAGSYRARIRAWCQRFARAVDRNIGSIEGDIHHLFHGHLRDRAYGERHRLPALHGYDPEIHLRKNTDGVNQLVGLPGLRDDIGRYFTQRREDASTQSY